jgi:hypothetical protein
VPQSLLIPRNGTSEELLLARDIYIIDRCARLHIVVRCTIDIAAITERMVIRHDFDRGQLLVFGDSCQKSNSTIITRNVDSFGKMEISGQVRTNLLLQPITHK